MTQSTVLIDDKSLTLWRPAAYKNGGHVGPSLPRLYTFISRGNGVAIPLRRTIQATSAPSAEHNKPLTAPYRLYHTILCAYLRQENSPV